MHISTVHLLSSPRPGADPALRLTATLYRPALPTGAPTPGLVVGHGAGSRRSRHDEFCRVACAGGFVVLALDFRGHGESTGVADGPLELDLLAAAAHLRGLPGVENERVCYRGSSMGGFYGLQAALPARFAALVLLCPASEGVLLEAISDETRVPNGSDDDTRWERLPLQRYFGLQDTVRLAAQVTCPVLLVHARGDDVVPLDHSLALAGSLCGATTVLLLPGGSHTSAQHEPAIHRYSIDWMLENTSRAVPGAT